MANNIEDNTSHSTGTYFGESGFSSTLPSDNTSADELKNKPTVKILERMGELLKLAEPYIKNGVDEDWQEFIATIQSVPSLVDEHIKQREQALLERLWGEDPINVIAVAERVKSELSAIQNEKEKLR